MVAVEEAGRAAQRRLREEDNRREVERLEALSHQASQLRLVQAEHIVNTEIVHEERGERKLIPPPPPSRAELDYLRENFTAQILRQARTSERQARISDAKNDGLERQVRKHDVEMADLKRQIRQLTGQMSASSPMEESSNISAAYEARDGSELSQGTECTICFDAPKTIVLFPCKHLCLCSNCSATKNVVKCPMCAAAIQYKLDIFP